MNGLSRDIVNYELQKHLPLRDHLSVLSCKREWWITDLSDFIALPDLPQQLSDGLLKQYRNILTLLLDRCGIRSLAQICSSNKKTAATTYFFLSLYEKSYKYAKRIFDANVSSMSFLEQLSIIVKWRIRTSTLTTCDIIALMRAQLKTNVLDAMSNISIGSLKEVCEIYRKSKKGTMIWLLGKYEVLRQRILLRVDSCSMMASVVFSVILRDANIPGRRYRNDKREMESFCSLLRACNLTHLEEKFHNT